MLERIDVNFGPGYRRGRGVGYFNASLGSFEEKNIEKDERFRNLRKVAGMISEEETEDDEDLNLE